MKYRNFLIGDGSLALQCAEILLRREHQLVGILTSDQRLAGWARDHDIPVHVANGNLAARLPDDDFDYLFSVANLRVLPPNVLELPRRGAINFHDSPLPRYAGVHATSWALMQGERQYGVCWHRAVERIDAGEILKARPVAIDPGETAASLNTKCFEAAVGSFGELLDDLESQNGHPITQDMSRRSYFGRWRRPEGAGVLAWSRPAEELAAVVRGLDFGPYPNPLTVPKVAIGGAIVALGGIAVSSKRSGEPPGTLVALTADSLTVATATEDVRITRLTDLAGVSQSAAELVTRAGLQVGSPLAPTDPEQEETVTRLATSFCRHEPYWRECLNGVERPAHPRLRHGRPDAPVESMPLAIGDAYERFRERHGGGSRLALVTAALAAWTARESEVEALDVGVAVSPRSGWTPAALALFAASVPMRVDLGRARTFDELVDLVDDRLRDTESKRTFARDVFLRYPELRGRAEAALPILAVESAAVPHTPARLPLGAALGLGVGDQVELRWRHDSVAPGYAQELAADLARLLEEAAAREVPLAELPKAAPSAVGPLLEALNATVSDYPRDAAVHSLFELRADRGPERVAVTCGDDQLTYAQLESRANRLARVLIDRGLGPGSTVGVLLDRTIELPVALMAVLKAGAAYLPLDPDYPVERLALMIEDSGSRLLLTEPALADRRPAGGVEVLFVDDPAVSAASSERPAPRSTATDLAYVIYTSGSTGRPKGVEIEHRSVVNFLVSMAREPGLTGDDVVLAMTTISFDISVLELFLPLAVGASLRLVSREVAADGVLLAAELDGAAVTVMQATPASWRLLLDAGWRGDERLTVLCGGEALPPQLAERLLERCGALWNVYGPTETTIWSTIARIDSARPPISIGRPIANTRVYVVDAELEPVPPGATGELVIGGDGLARGYHDRPELTAERFVESRSAATGEGRLYRTGDVARIAADGTLECLGRIDHQVKIRGFRIEPGEIESALESHTAVRTAVVVAREDASGHKRLIAYLVPAGDDRPAASRIDELRELLSDELPAHMVPSAFVELDELPLTGSGKIDRKALPEPASAVRFSPRGALPATETEKAIAEVWEEALELGPVGVDDDFFALGGHSLLLHQVRTRLQERLGAELAMVELFRHPTISELAAYLGGRSADLCDDTGVYGRGNPHPLAVMARRFLIPRSLLSLYFFYRFRAKVSPRAEVELSPNLSLGRGTTIGSFTKVKADKGPLVIGERSSFANGCFIGSGPAGLRIGRNLVCGPNVTIVPSNYVIDRKDVHLADQGHTSKGIRIGDNVWIGAGSTILDGSELGDNTIVTAGSVVDRKFDGDCVLRGNPAEPVADR